jgi:uncharacterized protein (DUF305 family)
MTGVQAPDQPDSVIGADTVDPYPRRRDVLRRVLTMCAGGLLGVVVGFGAAQLTPSAAPPDADSVEVGFAQDMSVHHLQAVEMADVVLRGSTDGAVRVLAYDIFTSQTGQVGQMQGWLALWGRSALPTGTAMRWMDADAHSDGHDGGPAAMPGMATPAELRELRSLPAGAAQDGRFLQLMLRHHRGGGPMLTFAAAHAGQPVVANFATQLASLQQHEVDVMTDLMRERGVTPL